MIKARLAEENKVCLVFDTMQANAWESNGKVNGEGISHVLKLFTEGGVSVSDISAVCLCDAYGKGKAQDYKDKKEYIDDLFMTYGFNVLVPVGAEAFTRVVGFKGQQKYLVRSLESEAYSGQKVIPLQNPLQAKYDPTVLDTIRETVALIKTQCEFPEVVIETRMQTDYTILDSMERWDAFIAHMSAPTVTEFAYDTETKTFDYIRGELLTVQWSDRPGVSYLLPCRFFHAWTDSEWEKICTDIRELHADESKTLIGHNIKYDNLWMKHQMGVPFRRNNIFCTQVASFLCNENEPNDLKLNAIRNTDLGDYDFDLDRFIDAYCKANKCKKGEFTYDLIPFEILSKYALTDADATIRLYHHFKKELVIEEQVEVHAMMMKFVYFFQTCESNGWPVDVDYCHKYLDGYSDFEGFHPGLDQRIDELEAEIKETEWVQAAWEIRRANELVKTNRDRKTKLTELKKDVDFKLGSTPNKLSLFFDVMKMNSLKKTKNGGKSTDKEVIDQWIVDHDRYRDFLLDYKEWGNLTKIRSTYVISFINRAINGRIHTTYSLTTAKTGRTASKNPNLQNVPARSAEAKKVKKAIAAPPGRVLIGADLQACEMRWTGVYSRDKKLIEVFDKSLDIHGYIAKDLFSYIHCDVNEVKTLFKFERNEVCKRVQFGALYGMGYATLTRSINASLIVQLKDGKITKKQFRALKYTDEMSKQVLAEYFIRYAGVDLFIHETTQFIIDHGYSLSLLGRKRRVPAVNSADDGIRATAIRQAVNSVIQSIASDALILSAYNFLCEIEDRKLPIIILGTIHDALYIETTEEFRDEAAQIMLCHLRVMPIESPIRMEAEAEWGRNWGEFSEEFGASVVDEEEDESEEIEIEEAA